MVVKKNVQNINPNSCLPRELTIDSVDDFLYRIGLCLISVREQPKRKFVYYPIFPFLAAFSWSLVRIAAIVVNEDKVWFFELVDDGGYFMGNRQFGGILILVSLLSISSQMIYYYNYKKGIKPTFLRVFQMIAGTLPPKEIGLTNSADIRRLAKLARTPYKIIRFNNDKLFCILAPSYILPFYLARGKYWMAVYYGIPNTLYLYWWANMSMNINLLQIFGLYVICHYLKIKINGLKQMLLEMKRLKRFSGIRKILISMDKLYTEIDDYNENYWSKFLGVFWATYGLCFIMWVYFLFYVESTWVTKMIMFYGSILFGITFLFVIFTASSVNYAVKQSYKTLISVYISYIQHNRHLYYTRVSSKLQVSKRFILSL